MTVLDIFPVSRSPGPILALSPGILFATSQGSAPVTNRRQAKRWNGGKPLTLTPEGTRGDSAMLVRRKRSNVSDANPHAETESRMKSLTFDSGLGRGA